MHTNTMQSYQEFYGPFSYALQVFVQPLDGGTFAAHGFIRHAIRNPSVTSDLPYEWPFRVEGEGFLSADAALKAGISFARKKVDDLK